MEAPAVRRETQTLSATSGPHEPALAPAAVMLTLIGLGLADETDITVKGLALVRKAARVYLEAYTSILLVDKEKLVCWPRFPCTILHASLTSRTQ